MIQVTQKEIEYNANYYNAKNNIKIRNKLKQQVVPNQVIDFLNDNICIYEKYDYGLRMKIYFIYNIIVKYIKYNYLLENEYIVCNKPLAEMLNLDIGDSILFIKLFVRICKLYKQVNDNDYEKLGME
jgi:hypothetical protein